jgi:hypothetical protein
MFYIVAVWKILIIFRKNLTAMFCKYENTTCHIGNARKSNAINIQSWNIEHFIGVVSLSLAPYFQIVCVARRHTGTTF